jgi:hypothetical protein
MLSLKDFRKATLGQLIQAIRDEKCSLSEQCIAQSELERRMDEYGIRFTEIIQLAA